jgi:hypothetical protein
MLWVTWRQHRWQLVVTTVWVALLTVTVSGDFVDRMIGFPNSICFLPTPSSFYLTAPCSRVSTALLAVLPVVVAVFWAAPLVSREYEQRTYIVAWGQDVSPQRWLAAKAGLLVAFAVGLALVAGVSAGPMRARLSQQHRNVYSRFETPNFDVAPTVLAVHVLAMFAFGLAASVVLRRTVLAMVSTLVLCAVVSVIAIQLRHHYFSPVRSLEPIGYDRADYGFDALVSRQGYADEAGQELSFSDEVCLTSPDFWDCVREHGVAYIFTDYQPGNRLGKVQLIDISVFLTITAVALWIVRWRMRRVPDTP